MSFAPNFSRVAAKAKSPGATLMIFALLLSPVFSFQTRAQQQPPSPEPQETKPVAPPANNPAAAQAPAAAAAAPAEEAMTSLDALLDAELYTIYGEVRMIGSHLGSSGFGEFTQIMNELRLTPADAQPLQTFLAAHAEELADARMAYAAAPFGNDSQAGLPAFVMSIEFAGADDAARFEREIQRLSGAAKLLAGVKGAAAGGDKKEQDATAALEGTVVSPSLGNPYAPSARLTRRANVLLLTDKSVDHKKIRLAEGKSALSDDPRFQAMRARFAADPLFVYAATSKLERAAEVEKERRRAERQKEEEELKKLEQESGNSPPDVVPSPAVANPSVETPDAADERVVGPPVIPSLPDEASPADSVAAASIEAPVEAIEVAPNADAGQQEAPPPPPPAGDVSAGDILPLSLFGMLGMGPTVWPDAVGFGMALDGDTVALRTLLTNNAQQPQDQVSFIPMVPFLKAGPESDLKAAAYAPRDTELIFNGSFDLPRIFDSLVEMTDTARRNARNGAAQSGGNGGNNDQSYAAELKSKYGFDVKEQLLPTLGSEIAVSVPLNVMDVVGRRAGEAAAPDAAERQTGPVFFVAVKDKAALKQVLPRALNAFGVGAAAGAAAMIVELSSADQSNYPDSPLVLLDDFLIFGTNPRDVRRVVEANRRRETLAGQREFTESLLWAPGQKIGQLYVSDAMMKKVVEEVERAAERADDETKAYIANMKKDPRPITYAITAADSGVLHEVRLPKTLLTAALAGAAADSNKSELARNEDRAINQLRQIYYAQLSYKEDKGQGSFGTLDQLIKAEAYTPPADENGKADDGGYRIEINARGNTFQATATPKIYRKTGARSFYIDETGDLKGGDTGGNPATASDKVVPY